MRAKVAWRLVCGAVPMIFVFLCARPATAGNCALYVRAQTGVDLYGAAGGWWDEAAAHYWRGHIPQVGAILVFKRTGAIPSGHVAVVARVAGPREIVVDQANWYHGMVTPNVPVIDTSPRNDWTMVAVLDLGSGNYGRDYPSYGFVYPQTGPRVIDAGADGDDPYAVAIPTAYDPNSRLGAFRAAAIADDDNRRRNARHRIARGSRRRKAPAHALRHASSTHTMSWSAGHARRVAVHAEAARYPAQGRAAPRAEARLRYGG